MALGVAPKVPDSAFDPGRLDRIRCYREAPRQQAQSFRAKALFQSFGLSRLCFQVCVDLRLVGVVVGEGRMNLRQRQVANFRTISSGTRPMLRH